MNAEDDLSVPPEELLRWISVSLNEAFLRVAAGIMETPQLTRDQKEILLLAHAKHYKALADSEAKSELAAAMAGRAVSTLQ